MKSRFLHRLCIAATLAGCAAAWAQTQSAPDVERTFPYSVDLVQQGLQRIGGFGGGKLPVLEGFVASSVPQVDMYERPYFQYRLHIKPVDASHTTVGAEALISALYSDPVAGRSEYRALASNGRLEADLLDRLQQALQADPATKPAPPLPESAGAMRDRRSPPGKLSIPARGGGVSSPSSPQEQLDAILAERQTVREKTAALQAQLDQLRSGERKPANASRLAAVKHSGVGVMSRKNFGGPVIFRAQAEDEFEVVALESGWAQVRIDSDSPAYIQAEELNLPPGLQEKSAASSAEAAASAAANAPDLGFSVSREDVNLFSGDWTRLKGKKVLFVYAQPRGLLADMGSEDAKLGYAKRIFQTRVKTIPQSQPEVEGVVVVFLGNRGGVAAATLADIRQWAEGGLTDDAFVNRCSLDPPTEFRRMRLN